MPANLCYISIRQASISHCGPPCSGAWVFYGMTCPWTRDPEEKASCKVFYNLDLEVIYCHFHNILLIIQVNPAECERVPHKDVKTRRPHRSLVTNHNRKMVNIVFIRPFESWMHVVITNIRVNEYMNVTNRLIDKKRG